MSGFVGTILIYLSKTYECLPPPPAPAPPAQGLDRKSLLLLSDYLGFYEQRTKIGCSFSEWVEVI